MKRPSFPRMRESTERGTWIPAFAGMTELSNDFRYSLLGVWMFWTAVNANSLIARQLNKQWKREGYLFTAPFRSEPCLDDASAEQKLEYALTNVVKDFQVEKVSQSPFFSTFKNLAYGEPLRYWYIDWEAWWHASGSKNRKRPPKDFLKWIEIDLAPLPGWEGLTIHQRQTRVRHMAKNTEEHQREIRRSEGRTVIGVPALYAVDPRDRPANPKESGPQPLCHSTDKEQRREFRRQWRELVSEHRRASWDFRNGYWEREFPEGSFRPPILKIYTSSKL